MTFGPRDKNPLWTGLACVWNHLTVWCRILSACHFVWLSVLYGALKVSHTATKQASPIMAGILLFVNKPVIKEICSLWLWKFQLSRNTSRKWYDYTVSNCIHLYLNAAGIPGLSVALWPKPTGSHWRLKSLKSSHKILDCCSEKAKMVPEKINHNRFLQLRWVMHFLGKNQQISI